MQFYTLTCLAKAYLLYLSESTSGTAGTLTGQNDTRSPKVRQVVVLGNIKPQSDVSHNHQSRSLSPAALACFHPHLQLCLVLIRSSFP